MSVTNSSTPIIPDHTQLPGSDTTNQSGSTAGVTPATNGYEDGDTISSFLHQFATNLSLPPSLLSTIDASLPGLVPPQTETQVGGVEGASTEDVADSTESSEATGVDGTTATPSTAFGTGLLNNAATVSKQAEASAKALLSGLPPGSANSVVLSDFLKAVASAIDQLKAALQQMQAKDAQLSEDLNAAKFSELAGRRDIGKAREAEDDQQLQKAEDARHSSNKTSGIMKILGPIVAAITMVVGVLLAPAGLGCALLAIGVAMLAYSIADSECGITAKAVKAFMSAMADLSPAIRGVVLAVMAVVLVAAIALLSAASPGEGVEMTATISEQAAYAAKDVIIQVTIMSVMASNVLQEGVTALAKAAGASKNSPLMMALNIIVMVAVTIVAAKVAGPKAGMKETAEESNSFTSSVKASIASAEEIKGAPLTATEKATIAVKMAFESVVNMAESALNSVNKAIKDLEDSSTKAGKYIQGAAQNPKGAALNALDSAKDQLTDFIEAFSDVRNVARAVEIGAQIAPQGVELYGNYIQGMASMAIAQIIKEIGLLQGAEETLEALIQMLTKLLNNISGGMTNPASEVSKLTDFVMGLFDKENAAMAKLDNAGIPS